MTPDQSLIQPGSGARTQRRTFVGGAVAAMLSSTKLAKAQGGPARNNPVVLLLKGIYQKVVNGPNLGLSGVDLNDGSWRVTEIHSVTTFPGSTKSDNAAIGHFYVQFNGGLAAYDLPGGAIKMAFTSGGPFANPILDGKGGAYFETTFELTILEATGIYVPFVGGHNHMVDRPHILSLADFLDTFDESCFCIISLPGSPLPGNVTLWWTSNG